MASAKQTAARQRFIQMIAAKKAKKSGAKPNKNAPPGQGGRFAAMVQSGKSPGLAAFIGRNKYGNKKFAQMAAKGKKG